jgi:hypothetical protein
VIGAGMAATDHDDIELLGVQHGAGRGTCRERGLPQF